MGMAPEAIRLRMTMSHAERGRISGHAAVLSVKASVRIALVLLQGLFLSALLQAQNPTCSGCPTGQSDPAHRTRAVCLSDKDFAAHIARQKPIEPPGLREPNMNSHGTAVACLCFSRTGKVTDIKILSGPAMMQQSVLESLKNWTFSPVSRSGRRYGGCGILRIQVDMVNSIVNTTIEE
jgi:hypothetical protein